MSSVFSAAQPSEAPNGVLELPSEGSFVELPADAFKDHSVVTVEGWVKWGQFKSDSRFFDFAVGDVTFNVKNDAASPSIALERVYSDRFDSRKTQNALEVGVWTHIAAVCSPDMTTLYVNGFRLSGSLFSGAIPQEIMSQRSGQNTLGRTNWKAVQELRMVNPDFKGQMEEVRVWEGERTLEQIQANRHRRLTGDEPGLLVLLNFDDQENPGRNIANDDLNGVLHGAAITREADLSSPVGSTPNKVLDLDGEEDWVEMEPQSLSKLETATIEVWVNPRSLEYKPERRPMQRIFHYGAKNNDVSINVSNGLGDVRSVFYLLTARGVLGQLGPGSPILENGVWIHLACVSGPGGMKLYANGELVEGNSDTRSFSSVASTSMFLGRGNTGEPGLVAFPGQLDEFRVWSEARTGEQIRANMNRRLRGDELNLVGLWNFDGDEAEEVRDWSGNENHGRLAGDAKKRSSVFDFQRGPQGAAAEESILLFSGLVKNSAGEPVADATVNVFDGNEEKGNGVSSESGKFSFASRLKSGRPYTVAAFKDNDAAWVIDRVMQTGGEELNLILSPQFQVRGKVTGLDGTPIPQVLVQLIDAGAPDPSPDRLTTPGFRAAAWTDAAGVYEFSQARPGLVDVVIHLPNKRLRHPDGGAVIGEEERVFDFSIAPFRQGIWRKYTMRDGLPSNLVYDLQFTDDGMLWIATRGGLVRFDGQDFITLDTRKGLMNSVVHSLGLSQDGFLWAGTEEEVAQIDPELGRLVQSFPTGFNGLSAGPALDIERAPDGALWIRTREGLTRLHDGRFESVANVPPFSQPRAPGTGGHSMAIGRDGVVWSVMEDVGLQRVEGTHVVTMGREIGLLSPNHSTLAIDPTGSLW
ncbi:hypothetical protein OAG77_00440, partial [bacterium]|nr:hypothetical protein [bacterium]